ncbi:uncharacterized protein LAESUDRAFT_728301 [Laetiporus sulphureus 93-53]|uniref:Uncharacterized protein n=1 Tax=Laetiporus sulphureus 93-53 TaxID=1314785 RepID=A0A165DA36_9APHY|nr:uncharacterized protein LAESUDRAFT_728301 [Laetiporus sulphureus 93-53]KZT04419.1 hypothetical protein LAESUDRAFT_728301 [Laetiporus sulphureus 93-53]
MSSVPLPEPLLRNIPEEDEQWSRAPGRNEGGTTTTAASASDTVTPIKSTKDRARRRAATRSAPSRTRATGLSKKTSIDSLGDLGKVLYVESACCPQNIFFTGLQPLQPMMTSRRRRCCSICCEESAHHLQSRRFHMRPHEHGQLVHPDSPRSRRAQSRPSPTCNIPTNTALDGVIIYETSCDPQTRGPTLPQVTRARR